jgi:hypothetical protein
MKGLLGLLFVLAILKLVTAQPDSHICCLKAAREAWKPASTILPWDLCAFGASYVQGSISPGSVPQVTATMSFCKKACYSYKLSNLTQWLLVLTTWVIPTIALLIICSTGECEKAKERPFTTPEMKQPIPMIYRSAIDLINKLIN